MPDRSDSRRPQDRDFEIDSWDKFPFKSNDEDPYENRSEDRKEESQQSQYRYEGWTPGVPQQRCIRKAR